MKKTRSRKSRETPYERFSYLESSIALQHVLLCLIILSVARGSLKGPLPYAVKKLFDIPVPSRDVTYQTLPGRE
jgi:hypothetical protein